jgi:hypothetical protein
MGVRAVLLRVVIGRRCSATIRVLYVGGSLFGCCCWSGAAVVFYWSDITYLQYLHRRGYVYFALQKSMRVVTRPLFKSCSQTCISSAGFIRLFLRYTFAPETTLHSFHIAHFTTDHPSTSPSAEAATDVSSNNSTTPKSTNGHHKSQLRR